MFSKHVDECQTLLFILHQAVDYADAEAEADPAEAVEAEEAAVSMEEAAAVDEQHQNGTAEAAEPAAEPATEVTPAEELRCSFPWTPRRPLPVHGPHAATEGTELVGTVCSRLWLSSGVARDDS